MKKKLWKIGGIAFVALLLIAFLSFAVGGIAFFITGDESWGQLGQDFAIYSLGGVLVLLGILIITLFINMILLIAGVDIEDPFQ